MILDKLLILNYGITKYMVCANSELFHPYPLAYRQKKKVFEILYINFENREGEYNFEIMHSLIKK